MRIGILGGGQLAQMLAKSGQRLGYNFSFLDPSSTACAFSLGNALHGSYSDPKLLKELAENSDIITFEFENVPHAALEILSGKAKIFPPSKALEISQDRWKEKKMFQELGIPTTSFARVDRLEDLREQSGKIGFPCVLKTRSEGYDGKGQMVLRKPDDIDSAWKNLGNRPLILENFITFDREVSIIAVRNQKGEIRFYDLCQNEHAEGILRFTFNVPNDLQFEKAKGHMEKLLRALDYVGVLTLEMFEKAGELLANEMAPRVHNSGHWTIEGAETSQFENHLRAISGTSLGSTKSKGFSAMANLIGKIPAPSLIQNLQGVHEHVYGKEPRPGRKLGHLTICVSDQTGQRNAIEDLRKVTSIK